ncbi:SPOR domain-containing protein [Methylobacter sp.]|uniref:SPOR domain-containing protein n=1 Tax=Methylobacter sp. TaxID=2051955 RepID=UPI002FDDD306
MVEDDSFTYHVKQQSADQINKAAHSLITKERTQKLDLLIHLLSNLTQALVVCGPEGIGKTTLLNILQGRKTESWRYCLVQGNAAVSFEAIQEQLVRARYEGQSKQVVLIIDNAGELVPGLIATIIQYAAANPALRVVFALTHDELQVKRGSDRAIDDCHIIEIPSLSEKQCGDFLQHLSTKPYANLSFKTINDNMIAHIYRETHGVPGRIIADISGVSSGAKQGGKLKWILILAIAAAIVIALGIQWLLSSTPRHTAPGIVLPLESSKDNDKKVIAPPTAVEQKADNIEIAPPRPESQIMLPLPPVQPVIQQQSVPATPTPVRGPYLSPVENEGHDTKDALAPSVEVNVNRNNQQPVTAPAKPESASSAVDKQLTNNALHSAPIAPISIQATQPMPLGAEQQKQSESVKATNDAQPPITQDLEIKAQPEPVRTIGVDQKLDKKQPDIAQQKMAERLWASREKLKQAELKKAINGVESITANKLETIQIPPKPVEITAVPEQRAIETTAVPEQRTIETAVPQQSEPGRIGSLPTSTLPPSLALEAPLASSANNFTLQLMVLSKQSSADDMIKRYPALGPDIRITRTIVKGKEKFILEYGSYPDAPSANKAKESLPFEFHRALVRKIAQ